MLLNRYATDRNVEDLYEELLENEFVHEIYKNSRIPNSDLCVIDQIFLQNKYLYPQKYNKITAGNIQYMYMLQ